MKKIFVILGIVIGSIALLLIGFAALDSHTGRYLADPAFQYSYSVTSPDGKYVFVMLRPKAWDEPDEEMKETRLLQSKYSVSGLYLNDGSTSPLWVLEAVPDKQYAYKVFVSSDGHHIAKTGWWANSTSDEALTFYKDGRVISSYSVKDVATASWFLPGGVHHYDWDKKITFNDEKKTLTAITEHYDRLVMDVTTGKIISAFRPIQLIGFTILGAIAYLFFRVYRNKVIKRRTYSLGLSEIIRINQLVRGQVDLAGFTGWYEQLSPPQQCTLINTLIMFAHQAGVDEEVWEEALSAGNIISSIELARQIKSFHNYELGLHHWSGSYRWLQELSDSDRGKVFTITVYLFGTAEGKVFNKERKEWCNHWWHRDLLDHRVVEDILSNPKFYTTSMKDDDQVKESR
jgi:hypothetical protein